jgi:hypothetical protein
MAAMTDKLNGLGPLPETLEYTGEFGPELVLFMPFCHWLSKAGLLKNRRIKTYRGMQCFYDGLDCLEIVEKPDARTYVEPEARLSCLPIKNEHSFDDLGRSPFHYFPDMREKFGNLPLTPNPAQTNRPLLIIHNKHNFEWDTGPINHIRLGTLNTLFTRLKRKFTIVYIRHGITAIDPGFVGDHNVNLPFEDQRVLDRHPEVMSFDALHAAHLAQGGIQDINTFKNVLYSRCHRFITSQGGGAHQIAQFSGSIMLILHRQGSEDLWAYRDGYYGFMAPIPPIRAICRNEYDLLRALPLLVNSTVNENRVLLQPDFEKLLARHSP